jgi:hypothetical protein
MSNTKQEIKDLLFASDHRISRVLEDFLRVLVKKQIVQYKDLPDDALEVLNYRANLRKNLKEL